MPRPQFTLRALLVAMLVVGAFLGGMRFERERQRREDEAAAEAAAVREAEAKSAVKRATALKPLPLLKMGLHPYPDDE